MLVLLSLPVCAQQAELQQLKAYLQNDTLYLENNAIQQAYRWNGGNLALIYFRNRQNPKQEIRLEQQPLPDLYLPGENMNATGGSLQTSWKRRFAAEPQYLEVTVSYSLGGLEVKRVFELYPDLASVATHYYLRGTPRQNSWLTAGPKADELAMIEAITASSNEAGTARIGLVPLAGTHWQLKAISFKQATDHNNTLLQSKEFLAYRKPVAFTANLVLAHNKARQVGFWMLKEAPTAESQQAYPGADFSLDETLVQLFGIGVTPADVQGNEWVRGYGYAMGLAGADENQLQQNLRQYQKSIRALQPQRDEMILMNTWGDRSRDSRMNEAFILNEIRAGKRLGITHLQLDDGWQQGLSKNSASKAGQRWNDWSLEDWQPHRERLPNGFSKIIKEAKRAGVELCLWFNPSGVDHYRQWERDADILISYYKKWGIRVFKIDGINLSSIQSEENLRRMFEKVMEASEGQAVFNVDVTAGKRFGYHYFTEYGNIFLENRYTDWANYYPHRTLRNLWMLSAYVPAEKLQIEWLNPWRNADKYAADDPLAPAKIPFDYQMAVTFMAQPLAWMEGSSLPPEAFSHSATLKAYRNIQHELHQGAIFPIGKEPDGFSWTGFQSMKGKEGFLMVYREAHPHDKQQLETWLEEGSSVRLEPVLGAGAASEQVVERGGVITLSLPDRFTYCLYKYRVL
ncbi:hypothetical protein D770_23570 [Flammeovirgaceae bacterium 311]|nr:hypothetical protein D770_23570 [Flammeovirgaceae bacterium 311]